MKNEWDESKNRKNFAKHGLRFEDAEEVFRGPCVTFEDDRFDYGEERLITLGLLAGRVVLVAHSPRDEGTRIISMRKGNRREQKIYQERLGAD
ncbi:MAG: BrnT family toxin [Bryobacteraceae bacterium]